MRRYVPMDEDTVTALREAVDRGAFPGVSFEQAMKLALTDGVVPEDDLPVESIFALDDWLRERGAVARFTTTDLKNRTGEVLEHVRRGRRVVLTRHGRPIAELRPVEDERPPDGHARRGARAS